MRTEGIGTYCTTQNLEALTCYWNRGISPNVNHTGRRSPRRKVELLFSNIESQAILHEPFAKLIGSISYGLYLPK